jgi:hypothetical protein
MGRYGATPPVSEGQLPLPARSPVGTESPLVEVVVDREHEAIRSLPFQPTSFTEGRLQVSCRGSKVALVHAARQ